MVLSKTAHLLQTTVDTVLGAIGERGVSPKHFVTTAAEATESSDRK